MLLFEHWNVYVPGLIQFGEMLWARNKENFLE